MQATSLIVLTGTALAWLSLVLLAGYLVGLLIARWRQFCSNSLMIGAIGSVLLTTLYLFVALFMSDSLIGVDSQAWLGLSGAGFSLGALLYAVVRLRQLIMKKATA